MSYRPICDRWILTHPRLKGGKRYYGAYLGGFPERARVLLLARPDEPVLHVCGGMARDYPYTGGFGKHDKTLDLDPNLEPDFLVDAAVGPYPSGFRAILADPPYTEADAQHYFPGPTRFPRPNRIVSLALDALPAGGCVGILHYITPKIPKTVKFIASVAVFCGANSRERVFTVFQKR